MKRKYIALLCMLPLLTIVGTYAFWRHVLPYDSESTEVADLFKSYIPTLPTIPYDDIERQFQKAHKGDSTVPQTGAIIQEPDDLNWSSPILVSSEAIINDFYSDLSKELNIYLYEIAQEYANDMWCGDIQLSPLLPLAEANLEGGRVNPRITFSAIADSSVFTYESVYQLANHNVTDCLRDKQTWRTMATEYYTRDRGALQCNPDYGANNPAYGASERELLNAYITERGIPDYGTCHDKRGNTYDVSDWIDYSRTMYGDRFNPESVIRMFADEKRNVEIPLIRKYVPNIQNEWEVYCYMAYCHWCGTGYLTMNKSDSYSGFQTIGRSNEYLHDITTPESIEFIYSLCVKDIRDAREHNRCPVVAIDSNSGRVIFDALHERGLVKDWDYYFRHKMTGDWDQGKTACYYPFGMIYGVMQMNLLYSGY